MIRVILSKDCTWHSKDEGGQDDWTRKIKFGHFQQGGRKAGRWWQRHPGLLTSLIWPPFMNQCLRQKTGKTWFGFSSSCLDICNNCVSQFHNPQKFCQRMCHKTLNPSPMALKIQQMTNKTPTWVVGVCCAEKPTSCKSIQFLSPG